jgi:cytochrome b561
LFNLFTGEYDINSPWWEKLHNIIGIGIVFLVILQFILGWIAYCLIYLNDRVESQKIHQFKLIHKFLGFILTFVVYSNLLTGYTMSFDNIL